MNRKVSPYQARSQRGFQRSWIHAGGWVVTKYVTKLTARHGQRSNSPHRHRFASSFIFCFTHSTRANYLLSSLKVAICVNCSGKTQRGSESELVNVFHFVELKLIWLSVERQGHRTALFFSASSQHVQVVDIDQRWCQSDSSACAQGCGSFWDFVKEWHSISVTNGRGLQQPKMHVTVPVL